MLAQQKYPHKVILAIIGVVVLVLGVLLFLSPPAVFPDPGMGFQVLRSMQLGGSFNTLLTPDQSDISQNYADFLTWWSPGQYLVPYLFKSIAHLNLGQASALTVTAGGLLGLAGFYCFFKKMGFSSLLATLSLIFIVFQQAFVVPYVFYNGGEILLFAFEGWFLYGCAAIKKPGAVLVLFVLFSGWLGFFCKSSFIWMYIAGLCCLWIRLSQNKTAVWVWLKNGLWIALPAIISLGGIYLLYLSKGQTPASASSEIKLSLQAFGFPLASPVLSGFSADDILHGLIYHTGNPLFDQQWSILVLLIFAVISLVLVNVLVRRTQNRDYGLFILIFYGIAILFFCFVYLRQLTISYEARHYRIIGLLIVPGVIGLVSRAKAGYQILFGLIFLVIAYTSAYYLIKGYHVNKDLAARGKTGIAQPNIDQKSLDQVVKLDQENRNAIFVFVSNDIGLEIMHNRIITLQPIGANFQINMDDYRYEGYAGPLYIVLPETYNGPREKMIMKSFPGYAGWNLSMLSDNYVLYSAKMKRAGN
jgi:hypothetical protein